MGLLDEAKGFVTANKSKLIAGSAGALIGGAVVGTSFAVANRKKSRKRKRSKASSKRKKSFKSKGRGARRRRKNGKSRKTSLKRIHRTKTGQPYIILASGKAKFIKKSSARKSRRRKGGRY